MSEPKRIGDILVAIAADPKDDFAKVLRQCPFIQEELGQSGESSPLYPA